MIREVLQSKIHKATVTEADISYVGSITIDMDLMERVDLWEGQKVLVASNDTGKRLETYVIKGPPGSGQICLNGACAHLIKRGEEIIIMAFQLCEKPIPPKIILVDENNRFVRRL